MPVSCKAVLDGRRRVELGQHQSDLAGRLDEYLGVSQMILGMENEPVYSRNHFFESQRWIQAEETA